MVNILSPKKKIRSLEARTSEQVECLPVMFERKKKELEDFFLWKEKKLVSFKNVLVLFTVLDDDDDDDG